MAMLQSTAPIGKSCTNPELLIESSTMKRVAHPDKAKSRKIRSECPSDKEVGNGLRVMRRAHNRILQPLHLPAVFYSCPRALTNGG